MRIIDQFSIEEIEKIVQESTNLAQVARKLGYTGHSGKTSDLLKRFFKEHNIDYSHFTGQPSYKVRRTFENTFVVDSTFVSSFFKLDVFSLVSFHSPQFDQSVITQFVVFLYSYS